MVHKTKLKLNPDIVSILAKKELKLKLYLYLTFSNYTITASEIPCNCCNNLKARPYLTLR